MSGRPNRLSAFFQELKRRNVIRVITVYAGAAFVTLELVSIIVDPLKLPEWTLPFMIVLVCVGFIIAVILSWIYDIHPEGGMVKTGQVFESKAEDIPKSSDTWKIASYISFVVILGLIVLNVLPRSGKKEVLDKSIAVLPFVNLSEEAGNEYFVDGLVEDLLNRISVIEELKVISRTTSERYRVKGDKTVPQIADELQVSYILEGSVQRYGEKARITVQLIDAKNDDHVWADSYDRNIQDVFQTQSEIATRIASELDAILTAGQKVLINEERTNNIEAFELYQMGQFYWNKRTGEGYAKSIGYFERAIEKDPGYGLAYAGLADTYHLMALQGYSDRIGGRDKAEDLALRALELDGSLAEAYTVLGDLYTYVDWEWEKADDAFQRALALNPNYSTAHQYYAEYLSIVGQHEKARMHINRAVELDPLSFVIRNINARIYFNQGKFEEALRELDICDEIQEGHRWTYSWRFYCYWQLGQQDPAFEALREYMVTSKTHAYDPVRAEQIYLESGLIAVLEWIVTIDMTTAEEEMQQYVIARNLALLGKDEEVLDWLERAFEMRRISMINWDLHFTGLHDHPRYQAILQKVGLGK